MKKYSFFILLILLSLKCTEAVKDTSSQNQTYGNTTDKTRLSAEKIDGSVTYEISFTLEKPADCISVDIESVYLQKTFPIQKVPKNTLFIVEKKLKLKGLKIKADQEYTPIGRNFNNDWEIYSPVKICTGNEPLSALDVSEYRIRFTAFEKAELYYNITITSESKIIFTEYTPAVKK